MRLGFEYALTALRESFRKPLEKTESRGTTILPYASLAEAYPKSEVSYGTSLRREMSLPTEIEDCQFGSLEGNVPGAC